MPICRASTVPCVTAARNLNGYPVSCSRISGGEGLRLLEARQLGQVVTIRLSAPRIRAELTTARSFRPRQPGPPAAADLPSRSPPASARRLAFEFQPSSGKRGDRNGAGWRSSTGSLGSPRASAGLHSSQARFSQLWRWGSARRSAMLALPVGGQPAVHPRKVWPRHSVEPATKLRGFPARIVRLAAWSRWPVGPGQTPVVPRLRPVTASQLDRRTILGAQFRAGANAGSGWCCWRLLRRRAQPQHASRGIRAVRGFPGRPAELWGEGPRSGADRAQSAGSAPGRAQAASEAADLSEKAASSLGARLGQCARRAGAREWGESRT